MLYNIKYVMTSKLYFISMSYVMLHNMCPAMLYNMSCYEMCHVMHMLCSITYVMLYEMCHVMHMLCYITYVMLC